MRLDDYIVSCGLRVSAEARALIVEKLREEIGLEHTQQGMGDTELMRLLCLQLFALGVVGDCTLIWEAKTCSMDADASIDVQLLCGAGLHETRKYLGSMSTPESDLALQRLDAAVAAGDFDGFTPPQYFEELIQYFET